MQDQNRRYDIDWIRVIAIGLLLVYHSAICFQSWGFMLGFPTHSQPLDTLWKPMTMLNVWRIPILFFISGMGVYLAARNRHWKQLIGERSKRILLPYLFGIICIVPLQILLVQYYYQQPLSYVPHPAHLWFLGNIFSYVLIFLPLFYFIKRQEHAAWMKQCRRIMRSPFFLIMVPAAFILEAAIVKPALYELYAMTWHGYFLGMLAFFFGYCFMAAGDAFWRMLARWRWLFFLLAVTLYIIRLMQSPMPTHHFLLVIESNAWIFSVLSFGYKYLNKPGKQLRYLRAAAYPVYILHMLFLYLACLWVFPLPIVTWLKYILVLIFTLAASLAVYEWLIRRTSITRVLFGMTPVKP